MEHAGAAGAARPVGGPPAPNTQVVGTTTLVGVNGGSPFTIRGFSWGASNDGGGAVGGGAGGKAVIGEVELVRSVDALSSHFVDDGGRGSASPFRGDRPLRSGHTDAVRPLHARRRRA